MDAQHSTKIKKKIYKPMQTSRGFWNYRGMDFFATSHGKGPSDGIAENIKRDAPKASRREAKISTATELYSWAQASAEKVTYLK